MQWLKRARPLLGTFVEIGLCMKVTPVPLEKIFAEGFAVIEKVQNLMGVQQTQSDLALINRAKNLQRLTLHPWTTHVLCTARRLYQQTDGYFDCATTEGGSMASLSFDRNTRQFYTRAELQLDLSGIAKGFAVDQAIVYLYRQPIVGAYVNAGGDLRIFGPVARQIVMRSGVTPGQLTPVGELKNGAFASSGKTLLNVDKQEMTSYRNPHHPLHRQIVWPQKTYGVAARRCMLADALTKVLMLHPEPLPILHMYGAAGVIL